MEGGEIHGLRAPLAVTHGARAVGDHLALHHAQHRQVLILHVVRGVQALLLRLQRGDGCKLLDHPLQQDHLRGIVDVLDLLVLLLLALTELEDCGGDLPHRVEHSLQGPHRKLRDGAGEEEPAEEHHDDDEDRGHDVEACVPLEGLVHVEAHHHHVALHQQHRGLAMRLLDGRRPIHQLLLAHEDLETNVAANAGHVGPVRVPVEEVRHLGQFFAGAVHVARADELRDAADPCLQREVTLREVQDVEQGDHHNEDDREGGHLRGHHVGELVGDDHRDTAALVVLEARQEAEDPQHP
mmetsp:Transcript_68695/g.212382  ORF Transcript_68695/g.212382 Transcript_68695/m.212382 type:complete len:296 (+) Transcript_68695:1257-2144(+)